MTEWKERCPKGQLDLVFPTGTGAIEYHNNIMVRVLRPAQVVAGVTVPGKDKNGNSEPVAKYPGLHALRHFYASWCINRRVDGGLELPAKDAAELEAAEKALL